MILEFQGKYKSLTAFISEPLTNFTIITGKNGSGKTQLLGAMEQSHKDQQQPKSYTKPFMLSVNPRPEKMLLSDLIYKSQGSVTLGSLKPKVEQFVSRFNGITPLSKQFYEILYDKDIRIGDIGAYSIEQLTELVGDYSQDLETYLSNILVQIGFGSMHAYTIKEKVEKFFETLSHDASLLDILLSIKKTSGKAFNDIGRADFFTAAIPEHLIDSADLFQSQVETIFLNYLKRRERNDRLFYRNERYSESNGAISDMDFQKENPAPWDIINKILKGINDDLKVLGYEIRDYNEEMSIDVRFVKSGIAGPITFQDLSSGEQVIVGLIIKLFTKDYYKTALSFPDLIVLDEPDAFLHPEMTQLLVQVLNESFVKDLGIKIIMTTHSPSTIAFAPEDCIFEMKNFPACSLKKVSKDYALNLLTGAIPTLSIDYKNHRQVFLESPTDIGYFQKIFNKLNLAEKLKYKLYFIPNERGKSNSDLVIKLVGDLRYSGMSKVYGLIDWDLRNASTESVFVHGEKQRYSIENFIYDGVYMAILFLEMNGAHNIRKELSIDDTYNQYNLAEESALRIQEIWDWYLAKLQNKFPILKSTSLIVIFYHNGKQAKIPSWFTTMQGHELEQKIKETFPALETKFPREGALQEAVSIIAAKCYPFVPKDSIDIIKKLSN